TEKRLSPVHDVSRSVPEVILPLGNRWKQFGPATACLEFLWPRIGVKLSDGIPRREKRLLVWAIAVGRLRQLDLLTVHARDNKDTLADLWHSVVGCVDCNDLRNVRRRVLLIDPPEAALEEADALVLSVEGEPLHVFQQRDSRKRRLDDIKIGMQCPSPRIPKSGGIPRRPVHRLRERLTRWTACEEAHMPWFHAGLA